MYFTRPRRERILELATAMLEEHGLTLPQETTPLRDLDRGEQLNGRLRELEKVRRRRARLLRMRWARGLLTLGLWRGPACGPSGTGIPVWG